MSAAGCFQLRTDIADEAVLGFHDITSSRGSRGEQDRYRGGTSECIRAGNIRPGFIAECLAQLHWAQASQFVGLVWARTLLGAGTRADWIEYSEVSSVTFRAVHLNDERVESCLFIGPRPQLPSRTWLADLFGKSRLSPAERANLLTGTPPDAAADGGATVCSCFGVGRKLIEAAIRQGCRDAPAIGRKVKAGTNCGSCVPELRRMIESLVVPA